MQHTSTLVSRVHLHKTLKFVHSNAQESISENRVCVITENEPEEVPRNIHVSNFNY